MADDRRSLDAELAELRRGYASRLPDRLAAIEAAWTGASAEPPVPGTLAELRLLLHRLAGSGSTFGFTGVGAGALAAERIARDAVAAGGLSAQERATLGARIGELRDACAEAGRGED